MPLIVAQERKNTKQKERLMFIGAVGSASPPREEQPLCSMTNKDQMKRSEERLQLQPEIWECFSSPQSLQKRRQMRRNQTQPTHFTRWKSRTIKWCLALRAGGLRVPQGKNNNKKKWNSLYKLLLKPPESFTAGERALNESSQVDD